MEIILSSKSPKIGRKDTFLQCRGFYLTSPKITEENTENANLISAAPDLLKALNNLMSGVENLPALCSISGVLEQQYKQAQVAVKKAYGHHF